MSAFPSSFSHVGGNGLRYDDTALMAEVARGDTRRLLNANRAHSGGDWEVGECWAIIRRWKLAQQVFIRFGRASRTGQRQIHHLAVTITRNLVFNEPARKPILAIPSMFTRRRGAGPDRPGATYVPEKNGSSTARGD